MEVYFTIDDVAPSYLDRWTVVEEMKHAYPQLRVTCFTIANKDYEENVSQSTAFTSWFEDNQDWIQIGVHGYDHSAQLVPEVERNYKELEECLTRSLDILAPFLPQKKIYRSPGFQSSVHLLPLLRTLGFDYIAYEQKIMSLSGAFVRPLQLINAHLYEIQPIPFPLGTQFSFISD